MVRLLVVLALALDASCSKQNDGVESVYLTSRVPCFEHYGLLEVM